MEIKRALEWLQGERVEVGIIIGVFTAVADGDLHLFVACMGAKQRPSQRPSLDPFPFPHSGQAVHGGADLAADGRQRPSGLQRPRPLLHRAHLVSPPGPKEGGQGGCQSGTESLPLPGREARDPIPRPGQSNTRIPRHHRPPADLLSFKPIEHLVLDACPFPPPLACVSLGKPLRPAGANPLTWGAQTQLSQSAPCHRSLVPLQWYYRLFEETQRGLSKGTTVEVVHGSLLALGELLRHTGEFMLARYREVVTTVLKFRDSKERIIRLAVISLLPRLAHFSPERFSVTYLGTGADFLLGVLHQAKEKGPGFEALGDMALALSRTPR